MSKGNKPKDKSKIVLPFKPTLTITLEVDEVSGQINFKPSKPVSSAMLHAVWLQMVVNTFQDTLNGYENRIRNMGVVIPPSGGKQ